MPHGLRLVEPQTPDRSAWILLFGGLFVESEGFPFDCGGAINQRHSGFPLLVLVASFSRSALSGKLEKQPAQMLVRLAVLKKHTQASARMWVIRLNRWDYEQQGRPARTRKCLSLPEKRRGSVNLLPPPGASVDAPPPGSRGSSQETDERSLEGTLILIGKI